MAADVRINSMDKALKNKRRARIRFLWATVIFITVVFLFNILFLWFGEGETPLKPKSLDHYISVNKGKVAEDSADLFSKSHLSAWRNTPTEPVHLTGGVHHWQAKKGKPKLDISSPRQDARKGFLENSGFKTLLPAWKQMNNKINKQVSKLRERLNPKPDVESDYDDKIEPRLEKKYEPFDVSVDKDKSTTSKKGWQKYKISDTAAKKKKRKNEPEEADGPEQKKSSGVAKVKPSRSEEKSSQVLNKGHKKLNTKSGVELLTPKPLGNAGVAETPQPLVNEESSSEEPNLLGLINRLDDALAPFLVENRKDPCTKGWSGKLVKKYLGACYMECKSFKSLKEAKSECEKSELCGGIVHNKGRGYELRSGNTPIDSKNERESAYRRLSCYKIASASTLWDAFHDTVNEALDDPDLHLMDPAPSAQEDDTIFISIASYRDENCPKTIRTAYEGAVHPENVYIGLIQQNCHKDCKNGIGWAKTREIVDTKPDRDCVETLCRRSPDICEKHSDQFRVLRLNETQTYGPFFARFLASKLWGGENYFMQIDAHMEFRPEWDVLMIQTMKATPSYPKSVVSNYPPSVGTKWREKGSYVPTALCGATFESAGSSRQTIRLASSFRKKDTMGDLTTPRHSAFTAAGFFFAHGSMVELVPYDPFLPYLFMGEEIALSIRMWTSGFDIYAPVVDVTRHIYGRKNSIKFWETVRLLYGVGSLHNNICSELIQRVQNLVGFPGATEEALRKSKQGTKLDIFGLGSVRTREQFLKVMQLEPAKKRQIPPKWCTKGMMYPKIFSPEESV